MTRHIVRRLRFTVTVFKKAIPSFFSKQVMTYAAAMSYYMVFSFPAMLFVVLWIAARFYKEAAMRDALMVEIAELVGADGAQQLMATIQGLEIKAPTWGASLIGAGVLFFTATTVLVTARKALNHIAGIDTSDQENKGLWNMVRERFVSSAMLVTIAIILLVSTVVEALIGMLGKYVDGWHGGISSYITFIDSYVLEFLATALLVGLFFRYLPDIKLPWEDIWIGAITTAVLFSAGQGLMGFIIGRNSATNLYAAAGSVLVLMLWVYYASALLLFGATLTFTRARLLGRKSLT